MPVLQTLAPSAEPDAIVAAVQQDGAAIVRDALAPALMGRFCDEVERYVERTATGRDDFSGRQTQRTGALVARSPACREIVMDERILGAAQRFLEPYTERIVLHLTQTIRLLAGQGKQMLHRDRLAWGPHLPRNIEPQFNTIWALTDFTADNGATRVVPGSQTWDWEQRATPEEVCQAEMPRGSVLVYTGSVIHGGGENRSDTPRMGLNITYCLGWLRQEENQYLSCPPHVARTLPQPLQELLGYTMGSYALGYYSAPEPRAGTGSDILPPEAALGQRPRQGTSFQGL